MLVFGSLGFGLNTTEVDWVDKILPNIFSSSLHLLFLNLSLLVRRCLNIILQ